MSRFYRSTLRTNECVKESNVPAAGNRDVTGCGPRPMHCEHVEGGGEDSQDVGGSIGEHVPWVAVTPRARGKGSGDLVDVPVPIGVNQPPDKGSWVSRDDALLPGGERYRTFVFPPRPVLGEDTGPVLPIGIHIDTPGSQSKAHPICAADDHDVGGDLIDYVGVLEVTGDPQLVDLPGIKRKAAISEIGAEQVGVRLSSIHPSWHRKQVTRCLPDHDSVRPPLFDATPSRQLLIVPRGISKRRPISQSLIPASISRSP